MKTAAGVGGIIGQEGLEAEYNDYLEGTMGTQTFSVTPAGNPVSTLSQTPATPGDTVVTSIDAKVQRIAEQALADAVNTARTKPQHISGKNQTQKADAGAAVVIDTRTGHVIAAANYPTYDPGVWDGSGIDTKVYDQLQTDPGNPLFSQAIQGQYAPGSTFKVVTSAAALDHGGYTLTGTYDCPGTLTEGGRTFHNFDNEGAQGMITFAQALTISCDTFFDEVGATLWNADGQLAGANAQELVVNEAKLWKLGQDTGIDLPIDAKGNIESRQDLKDYDAKNHALWCCGGEDRQGSEPEGHRPEQLPVPHPRAVPDRRSGERSDRPGHDDRVPASDGRSLRGDRQRRHPLLTACSARRSSAPTASSCRRSTRRRPSFRYRKRYCSTSSRHWSGS